MSYFESQEERKLQRLQQKAGFNVHDFIEEKSEDFFDSLDQEVVTQLFMKMMSVKVIDGEGLNEALNILARKQAILELEQTIEYNEQMMIDKALC